MQSKCLELKKKREKSSRGNKDAEQLLKVRREIKSWGNKDAEQLLRVRRREKELRKKGCREFA